VLAFCARAQKCSDSYVVSGGRSFRINTEVVRINTELIFSKHQNYMRNSVLFLKIR